MEKSVGMYDGSHLNSQFLEEEEEVDLIQIFHDVKSAVINNKRLAITIFLAVNTIFFISAKIENKNSRYIRTVVQLDYDHASEGLNLDGTKFMKDRLINGAILSSLYRSYNLGEDYEGNIDKLKEAISIEGIVPSDIKYISDLKLKAGENYRYTPIQYTIMFKYGNIEKGKKFLEKLVSQSNEKYKNKYLPNQELGKVSFNQRQEQEYDYYDYIDIFNTKVDQIQSKINFLKSQNFQSKTSRLSYSDLESELSKLKNVEISSYYAEIQVGKISKDALNTKMNYENKIRLLDIEKMKLKDRAVAIAEVIKTYKPTEKQVIVTGITENIRLNNLDGYYSDLVNLYKDTVVSITDLDSKMREYKANIKDLRIPTSEEENKLEEKRIIIMQSMNELIEDTEATLNSYYAEKYNKFIDVIVPVHAVSSGKEKIIILLGIVVSVLLSLLGSYVKEFFIKKWIRD